MDRERRKRKRITFVVDAKLNIGTQWYDCSCENISMSGMLINSRHKFKKNETGLVQIEQKSGSTSLDIRAKFVITRNSEKNDNDEMFEAGIKFLEFFDESSLNLYRIVRQYDAI